MKAKILVILAAALVVVPTALAGSASTASRAAKPVTINFYSSGDVNVQSLWNDHLIPAFEKANPGIKVKLIFSVHGVNDQVTLARIGAAVKQRKWPGFDLLEGSIVQTLAADGLDQPVLKAIIPNLAKVNKVLLDPVKGAAIPYRGSSVVLAYDSAHVPSPPKTLNALLQWIRANPGKFTYNSPNTGGSGFAFAETVVDSTIPPNVLTQMDNDYVPDLESYWKTGLATLHGLNKYVYQGVYPNGNQAVLDLLGKGQIWVAPVWSDQSLTALQNGQLPSSVKLTQISNPPFTGGASYLGIPKTARNKAAVDKFVDFVLSPQSQVTIVNVMAGFPAINVKYLGDAIRLKFENVAANTLRPGYSSKMGSDFKAQWQQTVP